MCGIGGVFNADRQQTVDRQLLVNMAAIQAHRGPDGFGVEVLDQAGVGFCHARLSIIDLNESCLLYTSPSPRDQRGSRMPSSA